MSDPNTSTCGACDQDVVLVVDTEAHQCLWRHANEFIEETADHYAHPTNHVPTELIDRIASRMTMASHGLVIGGPVTLIGDILAPVAKTIERLIAYAEQHPEALVPATAFVLSDYQAGVVAGLEQVPDTLPENWMEE